ncbi:GDP-L-fucose synthase [Oleidesulfovibrio sp.]|uniref:GDP-L-fucose synthase n=1 Tax=Oleidesulfovibrio sp. TaxID=2909707 RepID=UPI003A86FAE6
MEKNSKIYVAGHRGLVGSALCRKMEQDGFFNLLKRTSSELDLRNQLAVDSFFTNEKPEFVFLAAAKVGGIYANDTYPAEFLRDNLLIQSNVIDAAYRNGCKRLMFLGSSCIYPKLCPQPIKEDYLLTGSLEPTNEWYAIAKIAGLKMCAAYKKQYGFDIISVMPTNLYGPNDNFDLKSSHVLPALLRKFHEAKVQGAGEVVVWGSGNVLREFLHVDDLADACLFLMLRQTTIDLINVGTGIELSIRELAALIKDVVGFKGVISQDESYPDGTPRKLLDVSKLKELGWKPSISLKDGILESYQWFLRNQNSLKGV